jgi:hypothetical protein
LSSEPKEPAGKPARLLRWALMALFWGALIFALTMALIPQPPPLPGAPSDKSLHMLAFASLTVLWALAYPGTSLLVILIALTALGGLIELVQGTALINREASRADWCADILAIFTVLIGFALLRAVRSLQRR